MLLCFVMIFSMITVAVPVYAAPAASTTLTVAADKTTAAPGDEITYTITMGPVSDLGSIQMVLDIPAGLTYVAGSRSLASGLKATLGFDDVAFTENMATGRHIINGAASAADYASAADTVIATFKCTVDAGATGTLEVGLKELEFISCQTFEDITSRFSVVKTAVAISGVTPPPATYTVSFNANGGTGAMADVTGVSAGAYTLPANGFTAPDGKRFVGWATSAGGTATAAGGTITVSDNVTLYAIWEEIPTSHPAKPTLGITGTYTFNGSAQTVTVTGFDSATMLITGNVGTNAGTYTASVTSKSGRWADGTSTPVTVDWSIGRKTVTPVIRVSGTYTYTGTPVEPTFTVEDGGVVISSSEYARTITDNDAVGTGKITVSDKTGGNYEILTTSQTFTIGAPTPPPTVYTSTEIKITADKTDAKAGDEITFTITMGPVSELGSIQMKLKLPAGLTVVAGSCQLATGLKATLGFDDISFAEGTDFVITGIASAANYRSDADTVIATFKCKVDAGVSGNLKADLKELEFYSVDFTDNTSRFSVAPATVAVTIVRTKVSEVAGTSDTATIPAYGGAYKKPTVTVTTGAPARFNINSGNGDWFKKNSTGGWDYYTGATFTEGTYMFHCQVRIDKAAGLTHVLDSAGVTVTVDGAAWTAGTPDVYDDYSLVWVDSPEFTVTAPAGAPLAFAKNDAWNIGNTQNGVAITSFSVAGGATGGTAPYTFSKVSGPAWLAVAPDGTVSGTPTAAGANENLVISVTDSAGTPAKADITLTVGNTTLNPADRTKVNKVEGTSNIATIPVYGGAYKKPTVTVTTGAPARFNINSGNGDWFKKNSAGAWELYTEATFTEGTYMFHCQVRIDKAAGLTHMLDSAGVTVTVDGVAWTTGTPDVFDDYSLVGVSSPEYTVTPSPADRTKVSEVAGTSDTATIPVYGGAYKKPTVTVTTGAPAFFNINSGNGNWFKKNSAGSWEIYTEPTFTEGTYQFNCQVRIDDAAGLTHMLDSAGVTVTVDGVAWTTDTIFVEDTYSCVSVDSPEYTVTAPAGTPLAFMKSSAWDIENPKNGVAIASFSVAGGATGGTAPYTFSKVSGPAWLEVAPDGTVSGTPTAVGANENLVIRVTDSAGTPASAAITLTVGNTMLNPADRTKVNKVEGTSDTATILVNDGAYKKPTVTVTTGAPAFFNINSGNGQWLKKNSAGVWERYTEPTFTEGTYKFNCQVRIDDAAGLTHMLDSAGVTVTVDGAAWTTDTIFVEDTYSCVSVDSPEYTVTSPSATTYTVTVTAGANMTTTGSATQNVNIGDAMAEIIYTAADGYYFPTDYTVAAVNGITVTRIDFTKIKVSGTPTAAANITLTAPTAKAKEATPTAVFTANGTDSGKLTGIAAGMKYSINGGAWVDITATEANLTGLSACTITIMKSGNGTTTLDSDEQTITVTKAAKPALTPTLLTLAGGKGSIPTGAAHEFSTDGTAWTPCTGATENLDTGKYYVRVKANGTQLASETQEIDIFLYGDANGDGKVDIDDLTRLRKYIAESSTVIFPGADANGDGTVDIDDLTRLRRYFAEEAVVLGT